MSLFIPKGKYQKYLCNMHPPIHVVANIYSCPCLVVDYTEELISRTFLDENRFRLVSQDRMSA